MADANSSIELHMIGYTRLSKARWNMKPIEIPHWRLYWNADPGAWLQLADGSRREISPGLLHLLSPDLRGLFRCDAGFPRHFFVHFSATQPFSMIRNKCLSLAPSREFSSLVERCVELCERGKGEGAVSRALSMSSLALVALALASVPEDELSVALTIDSRVRKAMGMIEASGRALRNSELAEAVSMAENSFARLFKQEAGSTPQAFSLARRVERARVMLQYGDEPLKSVAEKCGFYDRYHFGRLFKKAVGESPGAYRAARACR